MPPPGPSWLMIVVLKFMSDSLAGLATGVSRVIAALDVPADDAATPDGIGVSPGRG